MKAKLSTVVVVAVLLSLLLPVGAPAQEQVTLRFSDWHLTEDVWNKSLTEAMAIFEEEHPNIKVEMEPVSYGEKETKYTVESEAGLHQMCSTWRPSRSAPSLRRDMPRPWMIL